MRRFQAIPGWSPGYVYVCPHHVTIRVRCGGCGNDQEFDRRCLPPSLSHQTVKEIEPRLKCSACGANQAKLLFGNYFHE